MRLVTWNVAGRVTRQPEQAAAVAALGADVVALQEVTARTLPLWRAALADAGLAACEATLDDPPAASGRRLLGVLVAAREPLERLPSPPDAPWPERVLVLPPRRRRDRQPPLADRARSGAGQGPHARGGRGLPRRAAAGAADPLRRPQHAAPRAPRRRRADLRPRQRGPAAARSAASAGTARSARSSTACASAAGSTRSARCTATRAATRAGRSPRTAAAGASTTCSRTACARSRASTPTSGAAVASATTRRSSWTSSGSSARRLPAARG